MKRMNSIKKVLISRLLSAYSRHGLNVLLFQACKKEGFKMRIKKEKNPSGFKGRKESGGLQKSNLKITLAFFLELEKMSAALRQHLGKMV